MAASATLRPPAASRPLAGARAAAPRPRAARRAAAAAAAAPPPPPSRAEFKAGVKAAAAPSLGLFLQANSLLISEHLASLRLFDWLVVDLQHSAAAPPQLEAQLAALAARACPALVRVRGPEDLAGIQQAADLGAFGIMVPTVRTAAEARAAVQAAFYPPLGARSIGLPCRAAIGRDGAAYLREANDEVLLILQCETPECFRDLEEILAVPGVDAIMMGPFDLTAALGLHARAPGGFPAGFASAEYGAACARVVGACRAAGVAAGTFTPSDAAPGVGAPAALVEMGFTFLGVGADVGLLDAGAAQQAERLAAARRA
jgi:2-keto-3-deoxy-L-rhamnonate aldolase RhmA